jgi:hypothetical protein
MTKAYVIALLLIATRTALASNEPQFSIKESHKDSNGVTFRTASGTMRIEPVATVSFTSSPAGPRRSPYRTP